MATTPDRKSTAPRQPRAAEGRRLWQLMLLAAVLPPVVLVLLTRLHIPLGCPGRFVYLYSPVIGHRLSAALVALLIAPLLGWATWLLATENARGRLGLLLLIASALALGFWSYFAPPEHVSQHVLNAYSPSHDGAFVAEAIQIDSLPAYLRAFPERARTPPAEMRGTRVVSNPPATTVLVVGIDRFLQRNPQFRALILGPIAADVPAHLRRPTAVGLVFLWALTAIWLAAGVLLYALGRLLLPPAGAAICMIGCLFAPATILFVPGKDPAQLLTVAVPLYLWLLAHRRRRGWAAALAGVCFVIVCLVSLVHVWIAATVAGATLLAARHTVGEMRRVLVTMLVPAGAAALVVAALLHFLCGVNVLSIAAAVASAQATVTRGPDAMPLAWQVLGLPLFLLFAGAVFWTLALWGVAGAAQQRVREDAEARLGLYLLILTGAVMLFTLGFTNVETPRLWIPFLPLLLLGGLLQLAFVRRSGRGAAMLLAALAVLQVAAAATQWSLMDMREAEARLSQQRFYE